MATSCTVVTEELAHDLRVIVDVCGAWSRAIHAHAAIVEAHTWLTRVVAVGHKRNIRVKLVAPRQALFFRHHR